MTAAEEKKIKELHTLLYNISEENKKHREDINLLVKLLNDKLDKKFLPVSLEENILQTAQQAIHKSIGDSLMDKVTDDLKQSPQFRAQVTLLISNLVMEMSKNE